MGLVVRNLEEQSRSLDGLPPKPNIQLMHDANSGYAEMDGLVSVTEAW